MNRPTAPLSVEEFDALFTPAIRDGVYSAAMKWTNRDSNYSADLTQVAYLKGRAKRHTLRNRAKILGWLRAIAFNLLKDYWPEPPRWPPPSRPKRPHQGLWYELMAPKNRAATGKQLQTLAAIHREVLVLHYGQRKSYRAIATALGVTRNTVKSRCLRARAEMMARLRETLSVDELVASLHLGDDR